jgi:hypothetical protein
MRNAIYAPRALIFFALTCPIGLSAQNVGIETTSPDSTLSINNKVEIGGAQGDILFTDDLGSITFPASTAPNSPMIYMFDAGFSNADRMVLGHSPAQPGLGLQYLDTTDMFRFGLEGNVPGVTVDLLNGSLGIGNATASSQFTLLAGTSNDVTTGYFANTSSSASPRQALVGSATGNGTGVKIAGQFESILGQGVSYGIHATASLGDTNVAVYGAAGLLGSLPGALNRAGWFDQGDVFIDDGLMIGSMILTDMLDSSAILELSSTSRGLLLPRMTAAQRQAISNPADGLVVYDSDSTNILLRRAGVWSALGSGGGGGGGVSPWLNSGSPSGIYYTDRVGVGGEPQFFTQHYIAGSTGNPIASRVYNFYDGGLTTYGIFATIPGDGTGTGYGVFSEAFATEGDDAPRYGVYGKATGNGTTTGAYGVYGLVNGTGAGNSYAVYGLANGTDNYAIYGNANTSTAFAGYFDGEAHFGTGAPDKKIIIDPTGWSSAGSIDLFDDDGTNSISIRANQTTSEGPEIMMRNEAGNVTIELDAEWDAQGGGYLSLENDDSERTIIMYAEEAQGQGSSMFMYNDAGIATIELDADFAGDGRVIADELELKGGSDLAEYFGSSEHAKIAPGNIVVIDPDNPGQVTLSTEAYDKKVVGIVSGANGIKTGMFMGQKESIAYGNIPVAIVGRVYVQVDPSNGTIEPGDFLTTSDEAGLAMRVNDWDRARGAIIGKALTYADENGYVLVLVHLQ